MKIIPGADASVIWSTDYPGSWISVAEARQISLRLEKNGDLTLNLEGHNNDSMLLDRLGHSSNRGGISAGKTPPGKEGYWWLHYQPNTLQSRQNVEKIFSDLGINPALVDLADPNRITAEQRAKYTADPIVAQIPLYIGTLNYKDETNELVIFTRTSDQHKIQIIDGISVVEMHAVGPHERVFQWFMKDAPPMLGAWWWKNHRNADRAPATRDSLEILKKAVKSIGFNPSVVATTFEQIST